MIDTTKVNGVYTFVGWHFKREARDITTKIYYKDTVKTYDLFIIRYNDFTNDIKPGTKFKFEFTRGSNIGPVWYFMVPITATDLFLHRRELNV